MGTKYINRKNTVYIKESVDKILREDVLNKFNSKIIKYIENKIKKYDMTPFQFIYDKYIKAKKIQKYMIEQSNMSFKDLYYIASKFRRKSTEQFFNTLLNRLKLSKEQEGKIINKLAQSKKFELVKKLNYTPYDKKQFLYKMVQSKYINDYLPNKIDDNMFIKYLQSPYCSVEKIQQYKINHNAIVLKKYNKRVQKMFGHSNIKIPKFILDLGYKPDDICLSYAIDSFNIDTIMRLITDYKIKFRIKHLKQLFDIFTPLKKKDIKIRKKNIKKNRITNRIKKRSSRNLIWILENKNLRLKRKCSFNYKIKIQHIGYQEDTIKILDKSDDRLFKNLFDKIWYRIVKHKQFKLISYMKERFGDIFNFKITKRFLLQYSTNVKTFKKLFEYDIVEPNDISDRFVDRLIFELEFDEDLFEVLEYLIFNLSIYPNIMFNLNIGYMEDDKIFRLISYAERLDFPFKEDKDLIKSLCREGKLKIIKYLTMKHGIKLTQIHLDIAIRKRQISIINYYISKKYPYRRKNMLWRILNKIFKKDDEWRIEELLKRFNKKLIDKIFQIGGDNLDQKFFNKITYMLLKHNNVKLLLDLDKRLESKLEIRKEIITNWLVYEIDESAYLHDEMHEILKILENNKIYHIKDYPNSMTNIINSMLNCHSFYNKIIYNKIIFLLKRRQDYPPNIMAKVRSLKLFKYLESKNLTLSKEQLKEIMHYELRPRFLKYIRDKYKYKLTLRDLNNSIKHNLIMYSHQYINFKYFGINPTPYTIVIAINNQFYYTAYKMIKQIKTVTEEIHNLIANSSKTWLKNAKKLKYKIEPYQPLPEEIVQDEPENIRPIEQSIIFDNDNDAFIKRVMDDE